MKRLLLLFSAVLGTLSMQADDYSYLTFQTTAGEKVSVSTESLTLSISGTTLTAGGNTFTLTNLSKMYFTTADVTAIAQVNIDELSEKAEIYDLKGRKVSKKEMVKGVYLVKTQGKTYKMIVVK